MIASSRTPVADARKREKPSPFQSIGLEIGRLLLNQLPWAGNQLPQRLRTLGVTSSFHGEGVTTVALQLALAAALPEEYEVLIVDCHEKDPDVSDLLNVATAPGLPDILVGNRPHREIIQASCLPTLSVLAAGDGNQAEIDPCTLPELIKPLKREFDLVIFDLPAVGESSETLGLAAHLDGVLFVVEAERAQHRAAQRNAEMLQRAGARIVGAILNKHTEYLPGWLSQTD